MVSADSCKIIFVFAVTFVNLYRSKHETDVLSTGVSILSLTLVLATVTLFPVDIAIVSTTTNSLLGLKKDWATPERVDSLLFALRFVYYGNEWSGLC